MSFLYFPTYIKKIKYRNNFIFRKELDSLSANSLHHKSYFQKEGTSAFTSKGSITLEAALVVPIFFFAVLCLVYLLEMVAIQTSIHNALHSAGKEIAQQAYISTLISTSGIEKHIVGSIGEERLERSMIVGGVQGIDCSKSNADWNTAVIELSVQYDMELPILMFRIPVVSKEETLRVKGWTGYVSGATGDTHEKKVYVTDYGLVYHEDRNCTYLDVSVRAVDVSNIEESRNESGGKYAACVYCKNKNSDTYFYFVTDYGDRYHTTLNCSRLKRNIYAIPLEEAYGLGGCSKCVE